MAFEIGKIDGFFYIHILKFFIHLSINDKDIPNHFSIGIDNGSHGWDLHVIPFSFSRW